MTTIRDNSDGMKGQDMMTDFQKQARRIGADIRFGLIIKQSMVSKIISV
jgi:hypothetical protein